MLILSAILATLVFALWLPNLVDLASLIVAAGRRFRKRDVAAAGAELPRLLFLVPAHNEELLITDCARSLVQMDYPAARRRIVIVADNSNDGTARLAREAGAECLERFDTERRGKPQALAWALREIDIADFEACVIVDADTVVDRGFARGLAAVGPLESVAAQAYIGTLNEWDNWLTRLAGVLARCRYEVTYRLRAAAGLNCPMTGNGMCIGRELLRESGWQAFSLTENWELYARYTAEGVPIRFAPTARLFTQQVRSMRQGQIQRSRWLAGRTWVLREWASRLLASSKTTVLNRFATLVELAALSPVLHLTAAVLVAAVSLVIPGRNGTVLSVLALASLASPGIATLVVLATHPQPGAAIAAFVRLPVYAFWRISIATVTMLMPKVGEWRKTERHSA